MTTANVLEKVTDGWLATRVLEVERKIDDVVQKVARLPTREEIAASDEKRMDRSTYEVAHRAMEAEIISLSQRIGANAQGVVQLQEHDASHASRLTALERNPASLRATIMVVVAVASLLLSMLCGGLTLFISIVSLILTRVLH